MKDKKTHQNKLWFLLIGAVCGLVNGFFGAGGGSVAVPLLKKAGIEDREAHATSVAIILTITAVSAAFYIFRGDVRIMDAVGYMYTGVFGAAFGAWLLKKISVLWLRRIFGALIVVASIRMFLR